MISNQELASLKAVSAMLLVEKLKPLRQDYELALSVYEMYSAFDPLMEAYKDPHVSWETLKPIVEDGDFVISVFMPSNAKNKADFEDMLKVAYAYRVVDETPKTGKYARRRDFRTYNVPDPEKTVDDVFAAITKKKEAAKQELEKKKAALDVLEAHYRILSAQ